VKDEVERVLRAFPKVLAFGEVPFTPQAKRVLELSREEARQLGHDYVGAEHLLLGLMKEGESMAAKILEALGADLDEVRRQIWGEGAVRQVETPGGGADPKELSELLASYRAGIDGAPRHAELPPTATFHGARRALDGDAVRVFAYREGRGRQRHGTELTGTTLKR